MIVNRVTTDCNVGVVWQAIDEALDSIELIDVVDRTKEDVVTIRLTGLGVGQDLAAVQS